LLTVRELAELLRLGRSSVYDLIDSGQLVSLRMGTGSGSLRVPRASFEAYMRKCLRGAQ
jgi:excisionase family DNA binding protein